KILKDKGIAEVDVRVPDVQLTGEQERELNLRLNKNLGGWDLDALANFDEELLKDVGFSQEEMDSIFDLEVIDNFNEEEEILKVTGGKRRTALGDIWQLGEHRLLVGDSTKRDNWKDLLQGETFDFMFTDPPYRITYCKYGKVKTDKGFGRKANRKYRGVEAKGEVPQFDDWLIYANEFQNLNGASVMIYENWKNVVELWQAIEKYWKVKNMVIWHLPNRCQGFAPTRRFFSKYDIVILGERGEVNLNEEYEKELDEYIENKGQKLLDTYSIVIYGQKGKSYWDKQKGTRWARFTDHITFGAGNKAESGQNLVFGTKPVAILVPYVKILSPRNGIVIDPFGGSGSTLIACEIMKRKCRLIEFSDIYAEVIIRRWEKLTKQKAVRIREGSAKERSTTETPASIPRANKGNSAKKVKHGQTQEVHAGVH
ncbi:MAG: DNA modification methylase, partial [Desulfobacteraceae bacterium]|nr:DNA modification methylase [Desulfobacteraceae bacterium]